MTRVELALWALRYMTERLMAEPSDKEILDMLFDANDADFIRLIAAQIDDDYPLDTEAQRGAIIRLCEIANRIEGVSCVPESDSE